KERDYIDNLRKIIKERRDIFVDGLKKGGIENIYAQSTFYVWVKIPKNFSSSMEFVKYLIKRGLIATAGLGFGNYGEGFVRFALTVDKDKLKKALTIIETNRK
ncbi:MAG: aminotransferase class I/II-fold pyridoxal phosphate-dependent enzyme, partial [Candidatus Omnitrophica bacterium]|nr:aminotransferase class I/II-fold pyridoxal phosphate-dependent enzyme [Candidatus Omnitrophota bacterium]